MTRSFRVLITDYAWPSLDIERARLAEIGAELVVAEHGDEAELVRLAPEVDAILTNWKKVPPGALDVAPRCRIVSRYGVGVDNIPVAHATELGIVVTNVPDFCLDEVADHTLALLLACARRIVTFSRATSSGVWDLSPGRQMPRLRGQTLGLVGSGNIARAVAQRAAGFGLKIMAYSPRLTPERAQEFGAQAASSLEELLRTADYVSLHLPATAESRHLIDERALRRMKPGAFLINTARGAVVDEAALLRALSEGWIAGAALDVLAQEPPDPAHQLLRLPNVIVTPHAAFYSEAAIAELQQKAVSRVVQALRGEQPDCIVNPEVLEKAECRLRASG